jgi:hypothetical protein
MDTSPFVPSDPVLWAHVPFGTCSLYSATEVFTSATSRVGIDMEKER